MTLLYEDVRPNGQLGLPEEYLNDGAVVAGETSASEAVWNRRRNIIQKLTKAQAKPFPVIPASVAPLLPICPSGI